jgi:hypothetical protein
MAPLCGRRSRTLPDPLKFQESRVPKKEYFCTVNQAGPNSNGRETAKPVIYMMLTDSNAEFLKFWFFAAENSRKEMLAVALSAMSTGARVSAVVDAPDPNNESYTQIHELYLVP